MKIVEAVKNIAGVIREKGVVGVFVPEQIARLNNQIVADHSNEQQGYWFTCLFFEY
jgi:hypothetical protein